MLTRDRARAIPAGDFEERLRGFARHPGSYTPEGRVVLLVEAARRLAAYRLARMAGPAVYEDALPEVDPPGLCGHDIARAISFGATLGARRVEIAQRLGIWRPERGGVKVDLGKALADFARWREAGYPGEPEYTASITPLPPPVN